MSDKIYGYTRISTPKQSIERQIRNIQTEYPSAIIVREIFTGTKTIGRREWQKLMNVISSGDIIVFDEVSRMSRNAEDGYALYEELFKKGVELVFLKEKHINTATYKQAIEGKLQVAFDSGDSAADELMNSIIEALNAYILALAKKQIYLAFDRAEEEVNFLHQRTREGIETARLNGKQIGRQAGKTYATQKGEKVKQIIRQHSTDFGGTLSDIQCMQLAGVASNTYYKYKKQLRTENE